MTPMPSFTILAWLAARCANCDRIHEMTPGRNAPGACPACGSPHTMPVERPQKPRAFKYPRPTRMLEIKALRA